MIFNSGTRAKVREAEPLWVGKFVLRILCFLASIVALCVAGYSFSLTLGLIWLVVPVALSIIWNATNIIVRLSRARPVHPGANVGCDLVLWLAFIIALVFSYAASILFIAAADDSYYYRGRRYCGGSYYSTVGGYSRYGSNCDDIYRQFGVVAIVSCVFATISLILHFTLFVWACVDTHRRNHSVNRQAAAMAVDMVTQMQQGGGGGGGYPSGVPGGYHGAPQPYYQQQPNGYGAPPGPPPPGVGPAYAQHQEYHTVNSQKGVPSSLGVGPHGPSGPHSVDGSRGAPTSTGSPPTSPPQQPGSPVHAHHPHDRDAQQPEVAHVQPHTY